MAKLVWANVSLAVLLFTGCGSSQHLNTGTEVKNVQTNSPILTENPTDQQKPTYLGKWKIDHVVGYSQRGYGLKDSQLKELLGMKIEYAEHLFSTGDKELQNPKYMVTNESESDFWTNCRAKFKDIHFTERSIVRVKVSNPADAAWYAVASDVYVLDNNSMLIDAAGVFIAMVRE